MQQDRMAAESSWRRMFDLDVTARTWKLDREFLLWQCKAWHYCPRRSSVLNRVTCQATRRIERSLGWMFGEVDPVGLGD